MPKFHYQALDISGKTVHGEVEARSRTDASTRLHQLKLQPVSIKSPEDSTQPNTLQTNPSEQVYLTRQQIIIFSDEISTLLDSGLRLEAALKVLEDMDEHVNLKKASGIIRQRLREGSNLATALRAASPSFGELYCNLISAGEVSGTLSQIMRRQCEYMTAMQDLSSKVLQSLIYPAFIVVVAIFVIGGFVFFLIPRLTLLLNTTGKKLSLPAQFLLGVTYGIEHYSIPAILLAGALGGGFWFYISTPAGKTWWHRYQLHIPLIGPIIHAQFYAQFANTLANLVGNGVPLLNGIQLLRRATSNLFLHGKMGQVTEDVAEGASLSHAMSRAECFPSTLIDLIKVGEQTGELARSLAKVGMRYERDMLKRIQRLTAIIQPTIIIILALVVGTVVIAIVTSIFEAVAGLRPKV